jgi:hypothetical protein
VQLLKQPASGMQVFSEGQVLLLLLLLAVAAAAAGS